MSQSISSIDIDYTLNGRSKLGAKRNRDAGRGEEKVEGRKERRGKGTQHTGQEGGLVGDLENL